MPPRSSSGTVRWSTRPNPPPRGAHVLAVSSPLRPYTDVTNYAAFFFALATAAKRHGYDILLLTHEAGDQELRRVADRGMADGVFLLDVLLSDSRADMAVYSEHGVWRTERHGFDSVPLWVRDGSVIVTRPDVGSVVFTARREGEEIKVMRS